MNPFCLRSNSAMFKPQINSWHSPDVREVWTWVPASLAEVYYLLEIEIGADSTAGDLFDLMVVSPQAVLNRMQEPVLWGRHHLIVVDYNWQTVKAHILEMAARCDAETWEKSVEKLSRYFHWEYEDYKVDGAPV
jgi:hypothetical protein